MKCTSGLFSLQIESECKSLKFGKSLEVMTIWEEVSCCHHLVDLKHMADHMTDSMTDPMTNPTQRPLPLKNQPHYTDLMTDPLIKTLIVTCTMIMIMAKSKKMWFQGSFGLFSHWISTQVPASQVCFIIVRTRFTCLNWNFMTREKEPIEGSFLNILNIA